MRAVVGGLDLELLHRVRRRVDEQVVAAVIERTDAVEVDLLVHPSRPAGAELRSGRHDAGGQVPEAREVPAAQRQVDDGLGGHDVAGDAALRLEQQTLRDDINHFANLADLEGNVQRSPAAAHERTSGHLVQRVLTR